MAVSAPRRGDAPPAGGAASGSAQGVVLAALRRRARASSPRPPSSSACSSSIRRSTRSFAACSTSPAPTSSVSATTRRCSRPARCSPRSRTTRCGWRSPRQLVTAIGLVFAVLTERIRWSVAFKTAVFMPMAISLFAAGVIWHIMYIQDPSQGAVNAAIAGVKGRSSARPDRCRAGRPRPTPSQGSTSAGFTLRQPLRPGAVALLGLTAIAQQDIPKDAVQAVVPAARAGAISGVVWRDFRPGGGMPGQGRPGRARPAWRDARSSRRPAATSSRAPRAVRTAQFMFSGVSPGSYRVGVGAATFARPSAG